MTDGVGSNFIMRNATPVAIAVLTVLIGLTFAVFYYQRIELVNARQSVNHSYELEGHIQELLNHLEDAETGERGYIGTGDERFLEPYNDALRDSSNVRAKSDSLDQHHSIDEEIEILRRMAAENQEQQQNIDDIERAKDRLLDYLAAAIAERGKSGTQVTASIDSREGKELMDRARGYIHTLMVEENHHLSARTQLEEQGTQQASFIIYAGTAIFYLCTTLAIVLYQRARQRVQAEILRYTRQLERSEEELKMQQEELKASNEEIEASNEELEEQNAQIRQQSEELKKTQMLIEEKAREIEAASRYKSEFLANMSHELRTPLNSLLLLAHSLAGNEEGNLTADQVEEARIIHNDGLELLNLINDILDLSKVEAGKLTVIADDVEITSITQRMQQQFGVIAKNKNVDFPIEIETGMPETMYTDTQRVEQIIKNLLSNAFKFTGEGSVMLRVHRPDHIDAIAGDFVAFSVIDTGIGIDASRTRDIFEAFQQEDGSTDRNYGGTGLGLTIARKFSRLLGGDIYVKSQKGEGSTFTLTLPTRLPAAQGDATQSRPAHELTKIYSEIKTMPRSLAEEFIPDDRRIIMPGDKLLLIIEDDANFARSLMRIAKRRGYKCLVAGTGKSGLLLALEEPVTAILLDLKLPDIGGVQVLEQLKNDMKSRHIPVHIITGSDPGDNIVPMRKGAIGYTTKPVAQEGIDAALSGIEEMLKAEMKGVLVVEDNNENQIAIQNLLKQKNIRITIAGTGKDALEELRADPFDCIILDLRLPDMDGFEWLERAEHECGEHGLPPVIVYTAQDLNEEDNRRLNRYTGSIIVKGARSPERLLDEVTLFLHSVESTMTPGQKDMVRMQHNPDQALAGRTILLVDDDLRNTFALSKLLNRHGVKVVIAENGQMALDKLKDYRGIDLVIMDIMMPVMDGYQAMRKIRENRQWANLPIIALTARAMPDEQAKCMEAGANDYLTKPVDVEWLMSLLRVWLFRQEVASR